jgi:hypothetical protein
MPGVAEPSLPEAELQAGVRFFETIGYGLLQRLIFST